MPLPEHAGRGFGVSDAETIRALSGLEFLQRICDGRLPLPPIMRTLNYTLISVEPGRVVMAGEPLAEFFNPIGSIHGGWHATLLNSVMACAIQTQLPQGRLYTTVEMKLNYIRPILPTTGRCTAEGLIIHPGNRIATADGRLTGPDGKLLAHGTETCTVL